MAQRLDSIDSFIAVQIFNKLYFKYKTLKHDLGIAYLYPYNNNFFKKTLEQFILENAEDFNRVTFINSIFIDI